MSDLEINQILLWLRGRSLAELLVLLQAIVDALQSQVMASASPNDLNDLPEPSTIQEVIDNTLLSRGWSLSRLAKRVGLMLPRLTKISEGDRPSREELAKLHRSLVRLSDGDWTLEELEQIVTRQYREETAPASIGEVVLGNWDELVAQQKIPLERLQALRDGEKPTEAEILRLAQLGIDEELLVDLSQQGIETEAPQ